MNRDDWLGTQRRCGKSKKKKSRAETYCRDQLVLQKVAFFFPSFFLLSSLPQKIKNRGIMYSAQRDVAKKSRGGGQSLPDDCRDQLVFFFFLNHSVIPCRRSFTKSTYVSLPKITVIIGWHGYFEAPLVS